MDDQTKELLMMLRQGLEVLPAYTMEQTSVKYGMMVRLDAAIEFEKYQGGGDDGTERSGT